MNWDEKALAVVNDARAMFFRPKHLSRFEYGAQWQREQLRAPEATERAARAMNASGWVCLDCEGEPGDYDDCDQCRRICKNVALESINALLGENK